MKKSCRIIITRACNFHCPYCCNNIPEISRKFVKTDLMSIPFHLYDNVCITGGEPYLEFETLSAITDLCLRLNKNVYMYTNGSFITEKNRFCLRIYSGVNVGVHGETTDNTILLLKYASNVRFSVEADPAKIERLLKLDVDPAKIKPWYMNECDVSDKEDWYDISN